MPAAVYQDPALASPAELPEDAESKLMSDGGSENAIARTDFSLASAFEHLVAQADIAFSYSMVEALWSQMKHRWLFLHTLDSIETVERLVAHYVRDHNAKIPMPVLAGRTPDEAYFGQAADLAVTLAEAGAAAGANGGAGGAAGAPDGGVGGMGTFAGGGGGGAGRIRVHTLTGSASALGAVLSSVATDLDALGTPLVVQVTIELE